MHTNVASITLSTVYNKMQILLTSYASLIFINFSFASGSLFLSGCLSNNNKGSV